MIPAIEESARRRYVAGIVNHASYDDLARCLASLSEQDLRPEAVFVVDTGVDPARFAALAREYAAVGFELRANLGWGAGVNRILARADAEHASVPYVLLLNPDIELDPDFATVLLEALDADPRVALASGKLLRPGRTVIDSAGIRLPRNRRPRDRGSDETDGGQYDCAEFVFGVSGAAMMLRRAAMRDLAVDGEVVDEDFFAYHDDTDLCWRANRLGWRVLYEPRARGVHGRRWRRQQRMEIAPFVRRHSFKNHYLQIIKNERLADFCLNLPWLLAWEVLRLGFAVLRDRTLLSGYGDALANSRHAFAKRRVIERRARSRAVAAPPE